MGQRMRIPFSFNKDFSLPLKAEENALDGGASQTVEPPTVLQDIYDRDVLAAEQRGFSRGEHQGKADADAAATLRMAQAVEKLGSAFEHLAQESAVRVQSQQHEAIALAVTIARKLAGHAMEHYPYAAYEDTARMCLTEARLSPHVVARVNEHHVEGVKNHLTALANERGFSGKIIVLGDPDMQPGDGKLEWADGGFIHDSGAILDMVNRAIERYLEKPDAPTPDNEGIAQ